MKKFRVEFTLAGVYARTVQAPTNFEALRKAAEETQVHLGQNASTIITDIRDVYVAEVK